VVLARTVVLFGVLIDGGIVNNLPTDIAQALGADIIIAVDLESALRPGSELPGVPDVMTQTLSLLIDRNKEGKHDLAHIIISPDVHGYTAASFGYSPELIERGRAAAELHREELEQLATGIRAVRETQSPPVRKRLREVVLSSIRIVGAVPHDVQRIRNTLDLHVGRPSGTGRRGVEGWPGVPRLPVGGKPLLAGPLRSSASYPRYRHGTVHGGLLSHCAPREKFLTSRC
jgi:hypothetical protein